jgi:hypothetical protein
VALARRTVLVDDRGEIRATPLTEKVQLRVLHDSTGFGNAGVQSFLQFKLRRKQLLAGEAGGLEAVGDDERDWDHLSLGGFGSGGGKIQPIIASCLNCHNAPGVRSMRSFARHSLQYDEWAVTSLADEKRRIGVWKREQNSWRRCWKKSGNRRGNNNARTSSTKAIGG